MGGHKVGRPKLWAALIMGALGGGVLGGSAHIRAARIRADKVSENLYYLIVHFLHAIKTIFSQNKQ